MGTFLSLISGVMLKLIISFIIFILGVTIGRIAGAIVAKLIYELGIDSILETIGIKFFFSASVGKFVSFVFYVGGIILALKQLGLATFLTILLVIFFVVVIVLSLFFGLTTTVKNIVAGFSLRKKFLNKKTINKMHIKGKIIKVKRTGIKVLTKDNDTIFIPFSAFNKGI
ncbi:MAG: hypothetical protein QXG86_01670 [Candidatus Woesearchaeota archaeon]